MIEFKTEDGFHFYKSGEAIFVSQGLGKIYRKIGDKEEVSALSGFESEEQKVEFENRVREIIREVEVFESKLQ